MADKQISELHAKYYGKKDKKQVVAKDTKPVVQKTVITKTKTVKAKRKFKIRSNGVLRIGGNHIVDKFGFKALQEVTIENPTAGTIIIKAK